MPPIQVIPAGGDTSKVRKSMSAIEEIFKPLGESIYKEKVVICTDKNDPTMLANFLTDRPHLSTNNQFFELTVGSIEEYYPSPWKKTITEVQAMQGHQKVTQAENAGDGISKDDFEREMPQMHEALKKCWDLAFS
jgi:putative ATP-dependent endonuclease of OLD family